MHVDRIFRGQNFLSPGFDRGGRRSAALRRDVERPAEMLAGMTKPDAQTVMAADLIIERADIADLLRQRRHGFSSAGIQPAPDLARQPWLAPGAAANHNRIRSRYFKRHYCFFERGDIAVDHQRNTDRISDRADGSPIGFAFVKLAA